MKGFILGVVFTLMVAACTVFAVSHFGLYPIGADHPPSGLERSLAGRAMDEYADKHKPDMQNPTQVTPANLIEGAKEYEEHCAFCHGGAKAKISPTNSIRRRPNSSTVSRTIRTTGCSGSPSTACA